MENPGSLGRFNIAVVVFGINLMWFFERNNIVNILWFGKLSVPHQERTIRHFYKKLSGPLSFHRWIPPAGGKGKGYTRLNQYGFFSITVVRPKRVQNNHESQLFPYQDVTAGANSFHAALHHRLQARVNPFLTTHRNTKHKPLLLPRDNEKEPPFFFSHPAESWTDVNAWWTLRAAQTRACQSTRSVFVLWRVLSEMCCSAQRRRPPPELGASPTAPDVVQDDGEKPGGWEFEILWCGRREGPQHMSAASPMSVLARGAAVMALRHDGQKIKTQRERDNCQSLIFDPFWFSCLEILFLSVCNNFNKVELMDWSKLPVSQESITSLQRRYDTFLPDTFAQLLSLACSFIPPRKVYTTSALAKDTRRVQVFFSSSCCSAICSSFEQTPK